MADETKCITCGGTRDNGVLVAHNMGSGARAPLHVTLQTCVRVLQERLADATRRAEEAEREGISDKPCEVASRPDGSRFCAAHQEAFIPTCSKGLASYGRRMRRQRDALAEALRPSATYLNGQCACPPCVTARAALATVPAAADRAKEVMPNQDVHGWDQQMQDLEDRIVLAALDRAKEEPRP